MRRFAPDVGEVYSVSACNQYGLGLTVQAPWYNFSRMTFVLFSMGRSNQHRCSSLHWNISFPKVVPASALVMSLASQGNAADLETLFKAGKASPSDVKLDGTSLLHVCHRSIGVH